MNNSLATPATSGTNKDGNSFKRTVKKVLSEQNDDGESLFGIIRNIVKEEFNIHECNIKELISSNVNKTNKLLSKLYSEIFDLSASFLI